MRAGPREGSRAWLGLAGWMGLCFVTAAPNYVIVRMNGSFRPDTNFG